MKKQNGTNSKLETKEAILSKLIDLLRVERKVAITQLKNYYRFKVSTTVSNHIQQFNDTAEFDPTRAVLSESKANEFSSEDLSLLRRKLQ
jgi:hypothetical protein